eukprot:7391054-Prymnesium_polylepis.1
MRHGRAQRGVRNAVCGSKRTSTIAASFAGSTRVPRVVNPPMWALTSTPAGVLAYCCRARVASSWHRRSALSCS